MYGTVAPRSSAAHNVERTGEAFNASSHKTVLSGIFISQTVFVSLVMPLSAPRLNATTSAKSVEGGEQLILVKVASNTVCSVALSANVIEGGIPTGHN